MEETLRLILAELQAIRLILDRDTGADAIARGFPNGPPPATAFAPTTERDRARYIINDPRRRVTTEPVSPRSFSTARFIITERPDWQDDGKANADQG